MWLYNRVMSSNDADGMANSVDPDQTAPLGAVWSGSALFAQAYLSENLGSLRYIQTLIVHFFFDQKSLYVWMRIVSLVMDDKLLDVARQKQANQEQSKSSGTDTQFVFML